ncbi:undecaprenyl-phosphate galactose phosphotransferase WbaP [Desulfotruncus alcoholivorax]|uniref:undecaprenyl-phosphate galactose phosphotransferase WbaP n=1 Tax=Desulfotruncus alcoholivorax TaxID=265477 RepID=UPI00042296A7|nr:undecaprenyl-phosphate galactose phosphotransferase WbaP [Desulfotruncus alcoholivorax]
MSYNKSLEIGTATAGPVEKPYLKAGQKKADMPFAGNGSLRLLAIPLLMGTDLLSFAASIGLAYIIRVFALPAVFVSLPYTSLDYLYALWWIPFLGVVFLLFEKMYSKRLPFWQEAGQLVKTTTFVFLVAICGVFLTKQGGSNSRTLVFLAWAISLFIIPALRYAGKILLAKLHIWEKPVIILGAGETGKLILHTFHHEPVIGYKPVGFLDDDNYKQKNPPKLPSGEEIPVLGTFDEAEAIMERSGIRDLIIAAPGLPGNDLVQLVNRLQRKAYNLLVIPNLFGMAMEGVEVQNLFNERTLVLKIKNNLNDRFNMAVKMTFDLLLSFVLLTIVLPVMLILAIAIKLDSKGPIIYTDNRIGKSGREFKCYKFRTMFPDADFILKKYLSKYPEARLQWEKYAKLKDFDPRVTRVGAVLRRFSFDELPQIFNVIKGDMSLVGPRPYLPREKVSMGGREDILLTRPGITGLWQVSGRNEIEFSERLRMDSWYVRNWSLWLDISILIRTIAVVIRGKGAY